MPRFVPFAFALALALIAARAAAQPSPASPITRPQTAELPTVADARSATWPLVLDAHALIGVEPHGRGSPVAFGAGAELLWRARIGGFAELLAAEGTPIIVPTNASGQPQAGFADRISVPFGLAARPLAPWFVDRGDFWARLASGVDLQVGATIEHLRTSDDSTTTAGLHLALAVDVPLYGGPKQGGVALRLAARLLVTPAVNLDFDTARQSFAVSEPIASGQLFAGLAYYP